MNKTMAIVVAIVVFVSIPTTVAFLLNLPDMSPDNACESTMDCDWSDGLCINWKNSPTYIGSDRTPVEGYACSCSGGFCNDIAIQHPAGLWTFCGNDDYLGFLESYTNKANLVNDMILHCEGYTYWLDNCDAIWRGMPQNFLVENPTYDGVVIMECASVCRDSEGNIMGGRSIYSSYHNILNGVIDWTPFYTSVNSNGPCMD